VISFSVYLRHARLPKLHQSYLAYVKGWLEFGLQRVGPCSSQPLHCYVLLVVLNGQAGLLGHLGDAIDLPVVLVFAGIIKSLKEALHL